MSVSQRRVAKKKLRALYERIPKIECKGLCTDYCGPIGMTPVEMAILETAHGQRPTTNGLTCSVLTEDGRCSCYRQRPTICRLWGVTENMQCPHGCKILGTMLTTEQAGTIVAAAREIDPGKEEWTLPDDAIAAIDKMVSDGTITLPSSE